MLLKAAPPGGTLPGRASCHPAGGTTVNATRPGPLWQAQLDPYAPCFTRPGFRDFAIWATGLALNVEEHTITQSLVALDRPQDWKALEAFAEHGAWDEHQVECTTARLLEDAPGRIWYGFHIWAGDDTKVHRSSPDVWGTCTFHEYTARCPNRAPTVRAHNWVVVGALLANPDQPARFIPTAGRLYFRRSQMPGLGNPGEEPAPFRTKCELLVELLRAQCGIVGRMPPAPGQSRARPSSGRLRRRLRPGLGGPASGRPRGGGPAPDRLRDAIAARRAAVPAAPAAATGAAWPPPGVGPSAGAAAAGGPLARGVAAGRSLHLRSASQGPVQGGGLP